MKKSHRPKGYPVEEDNANQQLNEAAVAYETTAKPFEFYLGNLHPKQKKVEGKFDFIEMIRKGVSRKSLDHLIEITGLTPTEMASLMHTSDRTLRRYTASKLLNPEQSERVIEIARLYSRGEEVFGSLEAFKEWVNTDIIALGNRKPKEFFDTSFGIDMLMEELGRIEHGIFA